MSGLSLDTVDEDILCDAYRACLRDYCYRQTFCGSKCLICSHCIKVSNMYGIADGDFSKWHLPELKKGMTIIKGVCTIRHALTEYAVTSENLFDDRRKDGNKIE